MDNIKYSKPINKITTTTTTTTTKNTMTTSKKTTTTTATTASKPTPSTPSLSRNGKCGPKAGPNGKCYSKYRYCGTTEAYCGTTCQDDYGRCSYGINFDKCLNPKKCCIQYGYCGNS